MFSWGSCQYETAYETYSKILAEKTFNKGLKAVGAKVTFKRICTLDEVKKQILKEKTIFWEEDDSYSKKHNKKNMKALTAAKSVDDLMVMLRSAAWDLWNAAPYISELFFEGLKVVTPKTKGFGPVMNINKILNWDHRQIVQSENVLVGVYCALLKQYKLVKNESSFKDFDT